MREFVEFFKRRGTQGKRKVTRSFLFDFLTRVLDKSVAFFNAGGCDRIALLLRNLIPTRIRHLVEINYALPETFVET